MTSRGIRNNNPGNIDHHDSVQWEGELPFDAVIEPRFCRFADPEHGIRAIGKILLSYRRQGFHTISAIINRWAPRTENDTEAYVAGVCAACGVTADAVVDVADAGIMSGVIQAIIKHENGVQPYPLTVIQKGVAMARKAA